MKLQVKTLWNMKIKTFKNLQACLKLKLKQPRKRLQSFLNQITRLTPKSRTPSFSTHQLNSNRLASKPKVLPTMWTAMPMLTITTSSIKLQKLSSLLRKVQKKKKNYKIRQSKTAKNSNQVKQLSNQRPSQHLTRSTKKRNNFSMFFFKR